MIPKNLHLIWFGDTLPENHGFGINGHSHTDHAPAGLWPSRQGRPGSLCGPYFAQNSPQTVKELSSLPV